MGPPSVTLVSPLGPACASRQLRLGPHPQGMPSPSIPKYAKMGSHKGQHGRRVQCSWEGSREEASLELGIWTLVGSEPLREETGERAKTLMTVRLLPSPTFLPSPLCVYRAPEITAPGRPPLEFSQSP